HRRWPRASKDDRQRGHRPKTRRRLDSALVDPRGRGSPSPQRRAPSAWRNGRDREARAADNRGGVARRGGGSAGAGGGGGMKTYLAGGFAERGTDEYVEGYEHARLEAGMRRRLMAFGRKNQEKYVEIFKTKVFLAGNTGPLWCERACLKAGLHRRLYSCVREKELVDRLGMYEAEGDKFELM